MDLWVQKTRAYQEYLRETGADTSAARVAAQNQLVAEELQEEYDDESDLECFWL